MERKAFIEKLDAQLKQWNADIEKLEARAREAKAEARIKYEQQLRDLRTKKADAQTRLDEVKQAGDDARKTLRKGAENAFEEMKSAFATAASKLK